MTGRSGYARKVSLLTQGAPRAFQPTTVERAARNNAATSEVVISSGSSSLLIR